LEGVVLRAHALVAFFHAALSYPQRQNGLQPTFMAGKEWRRLDNKAHGNAGWTYTMPNQTIIGGS